MGEDRTVPPPDGVPVRVLPGDLAAALSETELVADIWAADARAARYVAERAVSVAALARRRRIECDRVFGARGGSGPDARHRSQGSAGRGVGDLRDGAGTDPWLHRDRGRGDGVEAVLLTTTLTGTWAELYAGRIDVAKMRVLVHLLGSVKPAVASAIEKRVLPEAQRLTGTQLRARIRRLVARLDADALETRRAEAARRADAGYRPSDDGMAHLVVHPG